LTTWLAAYTDRYFRFGLQRPQGIRTTFLCQPDETHAQFLETEAASPAPTIVKGYLAGAGSTEDQRDPVYSRGGVLPAGVYLHLGGPPLLSLVRPLRARTPW